MDGEGVFVGFGLRVCVMVGGHGRKISVLVGLAAMAAGSVAVSDDFVVGTGDDVGVLVGSGVPVTIDAPGVRKSIHPGCVRMEASTGSMNPLGRLVR